MRTADRWSPLIPGVELPRKSSEIVLRETSVMLAGRRSCPPAMSFRLLGMPQTNYMTEVALPSFLVALSQGETGLKKIQVFSETRGQE